MKTTDIIINLASNLMVAFFMSAVLFKFTDIHQLALISISLSLFLMLSFPFLTSLVYPRNHLAINDKQEPQSFIQKDLQIKTILNTHEHKANPLVKKTVENGVLRKKAELKDTVVLNKQHQVAIELTPSQAISTPHSDKSLDLLEQLARRIEMIDKNVSEKLDHISAQTKIPNGSLSQAESIHFEAQLPKKTYHIKPNNALKDRPTNPVSWSDFLEAKITPNPDEKNKKLLDFMNKIESLIEDNKEYVKKDIA